MMVLPFIQHLHHVEITCIVNKTKQNKTKQNKTQACAVQVSPFILRTLYTASPIIATVVFYRNGSVPV
jgi:flagellar biogenesis protein FliO